MLFSNKMNVATILNGFARITAGQELGTTGESDLKSLLNANDPTQLGQT